MTQIEQQLAAHTADLAFLNAQKTQITKAAARAEKKIQDEAAANIEGLKDKRDVDLARLDAQITLKEQHIGALQAAIAKIEEEEPISELSKP